MSVVIQEKAIPVIGVPPPPHPPPVPKLSDIPPLIPNKPKTLQNPTKRIPKKAPQPQNQNPPKNPGVKKTRRSNRKMIGPKNESGLITETGLPKSENGAFVKTNEQKLTAMEQKAYSLYLDAHMSKAADNMTKKAKRRHRFQLQLKWLLNKAVMMNYVNKGELAKEMAKEAAEKAENALPKEDVQKAPAPPKEKIPKTLKVPQQQKLPSMRQPKQSKYKLDNRQKVTSLMDVQLPQSDDMYYHNQSATTDYQSSSDSSRGYQYLEENWINADKPWRSFQTSSSSYPTSSDYSQYPNHSTSMNEPMQSYPLSTSSTIDYSAYPQMTSSYAAPLNFATHQPPPSYSSFPSQLASNPMPPSFSQPPPDFTQAPPNFIPSISEFNIPQGYVSEYRQQFPEQPQSIQNSFPPTQSYLPFSTAGLPLETALEVSEEELARQKRLLEIEEELREINAKKLRMQMEDEMRQREYELALQEQQIQERERQIRDREMFMQEGRGRDRRHRYDDRGSYYQDERDDGYYRSSEPRHSSSSSKSNSHSNPRQIKIERDPEDAAAARRHGQPSQQQQQQQQKRNEKKSLPRKMMKRNGGGEEGNTSLKRSAESGSHDDIGNNIAGRIQPAKKQRVRHPKVPHAKLDMQAISDDEAGTHNFDYRPISDDEADI